VRPKAAPVTRGDIAFVFEGRTLTAREGDTVAAALFAHGSWSSAGASKITARGAIVRARSLLCLRDAGRRPPRRAHLRDPGARRHDGHTRARVAERGPRPAARRDALSPLLPPGFYYRRFRRSPRLLPRSSAASRTSPDRAAAERRGGAASGRRPLRRDDADVLVVGAGLAGLSAALAAAGEGVRVLLVEQDDRLGGRLADEPARARGVVLPSGEG